MTFLRSMFTFEGDYTPLQHLALALAIQTAFLLAFFLLGSPLAGAITGALCAFSLMAGRETAQAEKRKTDWPVEYKDSYLRGLFFWMWDKPSQRDLFWPTLGVLLVTAAVMALRAALAGL